jgi:hypothetical protein
MGAGVALRRSRVIVDVAASGCLRLGSAGTFIHIANLSQVTQAAPSAVYTALSRD